MAFPMHFSKSVLRNAKVNYGKCLKVLFIYKMPHYTVYLNIHKSIVGCPWIFFSDFFTIFKCVALPDDPSSH